MVQGFGTLWYSTQPYSSNSCGAIYTVMYSDYDRSTCYLNASTVFPRKLDFSG